MDELSSISEELKSSLRKKTALSDISFDLWFGEFTLTSLTEDRAIFSTPTALKRKILLTKYIGQIEEALTEIIGFNVFIEINSLGTESFNKEKEEPSVVVDLSSKKIEESEKKEREIDNILREKDTEKHSILDDYTFDNFIEGSSNKFAKAACLAVAKDPCYYNPLFIYGQSGLGKTHLLYAVMDYMRKNHQGLNIIYKKSENFINEMVDAISNHLTAPFKEKYRSADVLLIDDIQFIAGKEAMQEEFFHTFSALYESEKQIILTSDRPPNEIKPLSDRLRTRFEGGLLADVQPPSYELRTAIIRKKSSDMGLKISNELIDYMAERLNNNIRQIEGVLKKIEAINSLSGEEVTKILIDDVISKVDPGNIPNDVMVERIIAAISKKYGVPTEDIKSKKRTDSISKARHLSIYIIKTLTGLTLKEIGAIFGRDHSTVSSSIDKILLNIKTVKNYESELNKLISDIKNN